MDFITSDGVRLCYQLDGPTSAEPILLLNGLFGDMPFWDGFVQEFSRDHFCIRMDHRGVGQSEWWSGTVTYDRLALDVIELLNLLGIQHTRAVGLCHGGMVGAVIAKCYPGRLSSLVSAGTRLLVSHKIYQYETMRLATLEKDGLATMFSLQASLIFSEAFLQESAPYLNAMAANSELRASRESARALLLAAREFAMTPAEISAMKLPALFLAGEEDTYCAPWLTQRSAALWPGAQFIIIPGAAHIITREAPEAFHRCIRQFWMQQPN